MFYSGIEPFLLILALLFLVSIPLLLLRSPILPPVPGKMSRGYSLSVIPLLHHRLPIANLRNALGEPFIESLQSGVFYPLNILLPLLPAHSSQFFDIFQIAHLYILLFGFLILARLYLPLPAAALLALSTALSGGAFLNINMIHFRAFAWLPLMMAGAVEMARSTERRGALLLSMGIVCSITAGNPQESVMHLIAAGVCYFVEQHRRIDRVSKFRYIKFLSVCICSLLIAAPAVWPFIAAQKAGELFSVGDAPRSIESVDFAWLSTWIFPKLVGLFPFVFIPPPYPVPQADANPLLWIGILAGVGMLTVPEAKRYRFSFVFLVVFIAAALLKIAHIPLFDFFALLPFLKGVRFHKYHLYLLAIIFFTGVLAAQFLMQETTKYRRRYIGRGGMVYGLGTAATIFVLALRSDYAYAPGASLAQLHAVWMAGVLNILVGVWCFWRPSSRRLFFGSLCIVIAAVWSRPGGFFTELPEYLPFEGSSSKVWNRQISDGRIVAGIVANSNLFYGFDLVGSFNPVINTYYATFLSKYLHPINPFFTAQPNPNIPLSAPEMDALRLLGATSLYQVALSPDVRLKPIGRNGFMINRELPKVFVVSQKDSEDFNALCANDPSPTTLLAFWENHSLIPANTVTKGSDGRSVHFEFNARQEGRLVINYASSKAWRFQNQPAQPLCNLWASFPVQDVKSGVVSYWPIGLTAALIASCTGFLVLVCLLLPASPQKIKDMIRA